MNLSFEGRRCLPAVAASTPKGGRIGFEKLRDGAPCKARRLRRREAVLRETPPPPPSSTPRGIHNCRFCVEAAEHWFGVSRKNQLPSQCVR
jgi:hypothetical protein